MIRSLLFLSCMVIFSSCNDEAEKAAGLMCDCGKSLSKKMSKPTKEVLQKAAESNTPQKTLESAVAKLDDEEEATVRGEMSDLGAAAQDGSLGRCDAQVQNLKVRGATEADRQKKVLDMMLKKSNCEVMSGLFAVGIEAKSKGMVVDDNDDEEKPKRAKKTETEEEL